MMRNLLIGCVLSVLSSPAIAASIGYELTFDAGIGYYESLGYSAGNKRGGTFNSPYMVLRNLSETQQITSLTLTFDEGAHQFDAAQNPSQPVLASTRNQMKNYLAYLDETLDFTQVDYGSATVSGPDRTEGEVRSEHMSVTFAMNMFPTDGLALYRLTIDPKPIVEGQAVRGFAYLFENGGMSVSVGFDDGTVLSQQISQDPLNGPDRTSALDHYWVNGSGLGRDTRYITTQHLPAPVPLPATATLALAGVGAFAVIRRRRKQPADADA